MTKCKKANTYTNKTITTYQTTKTQTYNTTNNKQRTHTANYKMKESTKYKYKRHQPSTTKGTSIPQYNSNTNTKLQRQQNAKTAANQQKTHRQTKQIVKLYKTITFNIKHINT